MNVAVEGLHVILSYKTARTLVQCIQCFLPTPSDNTPPTSSSENPATNNPNDSTIPASTSTDSKDSPIPAVFPELEALSLELDAEGKLGERGSGEGEGEVVPDLVVAVAPGEIVVQVKVYPPYTINPITSPNYYL